MGRYFGSDLNEFIAEYCDHNFTAINIDLFLLKWEKKVIRIIEAKHENEPVGDQQFKALQFLADCIAGVFVNGWEIAVYITRGNKPYERLDVFDLSRGRNFRIIGQDKVINWLSFNTNLFEISEEITLGINSTYKRLGV